MSHLDDQTADAESARALVLFSGGQDSSTALAWALERYDTVETVGFDYNQRHRIELEAIDRVRAGLAALRSDWASRLGAHHNVALPGYHAVAESALTRDAEITLTTSGLPSTFVPGRNLLFFTYAAALAYRRGARVLVGGMCQTDYSGYPDCRRAVLDMQLAALNAGMAADFRLETPLMDLTKAQTWALAHDLGGDGLVDLIVSESHTCYRGVRDRVWPWGKGCANCPACDLRRAGWREWRASVAA
ncbi:MAG: 7-cyano-7-deazaguanine synthase QueC [Maricaulaceae bacterium]